MLVFVTQLVALLVCGRLLGALFRRLHQPPVVGELLAGVLLGPTVLERLAPGAYAALWPKVPAQVALLAGAAKLGTLLLLFIAGLEIDLTLLRLRGRAALLTSVTGVVLPFATGVLLALGLSDDHMGPIATRGTFVLFLGVAMSISAIPVIARILLDLRLMNTAVGQVIMASAVVDDLIGWLGFGGILLALDQPGVRGTIEHAAWVFVSFYAGVAVGATGRLPERVKRRVMEVVLHVFSPIFFGTVGLKVDFLAHARPGLMLVLIAIASLGKVGGCSLGAWWGGFTPREALAVGFGMNARGAMGIVLALLALQAGLIREDLFAALIAVAIATSMASGPVLARVVAPPSPDRNNGDGC